MFLTAAHTHGCDHSPLSVSQCSVTCGQGKTTRQVLCVNFSDQEVNASECDPDDRPATEQDCAMSQCPSRSSEPRPFPSSPNTSARNNLPHSESHQWRTGPWGAVRLLAPAFFLVFAILLEGHQLNAGVSLKNRVLLFGAQVETCRHIIINNGRILMVFSLKMLHACALRAVGQD